MRIDILASGSSANCYRIQDSQSAFLIEAGLSIKSIKQKLLYKLSDISFVLIGHAHL